MRRPEKELKSAPRPPAWILRYVVATVCLWTLGCPSAGREDARGRFAESCVRDCVEETADASICDSLCACVVRELVASEPADELQKLFRRAVANTADARDTSLLRQTRERCRTHRGS